MNDTAKDWRAERNATNANIDAKLAELGLSIAAEFVPASRFKGDEWRSNAVNFTVTIRRNDRALYSGPYAYGVGNLPGYRRDRATKMYWHGYVADACERGVWPSQGLTTHMGTHPISTKAPAPSLRDVMYSLLSDASAIDHPNFESWAADFGYDTDSRKIEATYRACVETGLALRAGLGDAVLAELRELFQYY